jgi:hypothetical protein
MRIVFLLAECGLLLDGILLTRNWFTEGFATQNITHEKEKSSVLKFGIMVMPQHPRTDSSVRRFRETVELTRLASITLSSASGGRG